MEYSIIAIFGKREMGLLTTEEYVDWAGEMLVKGFDSPSLRVLAGLDKFTSGFEVESRFTRSIQELGFEVPERHAALRAYACGLAERIVARQQPAKEALRALHKIFIASDYSRDYLVWSDLDDALDDLIYGNYPFGYELHGKYTDMLGTVTLENFDEIIKLEAQDFVQSICSTKVDHSS
jgi:hypothetical protein